MSILKTIKTSITYRVPAWHNCNGMSSKNIGQPDSTLCRFSIKGSKNTYRCALYNTPLSTIGNVLVEKTEDCKRATAGFKSTVEDAPEQDRGPVVDPKLIMKMTLDMYTKTKQSLLAQGYPEKIADKVAREDTLGGLQ